MCCTVRLMSLQRSVNDSCWSNDAIKQNLGENISFKSISVRVGPLSCLLGRLSDFEDVGRTDE